MESKLEGTVNYLQVFVCALDAVRMKSRKIGHQSGKRKPI